MADDLHDEALERLPEERRRRLRKIAAATALSAPLVLSFPGCWSDPQVPTVPTAVPF